MTIGFDCYRSTASNAAATLVMAKESAQQSGFNLKRLPLSPLNCLSQCWSRCRLGNFD